MTHRKTWTQKYGAPGNTDPEGFDPYADTVGPGIYGGRVLRDEHGKLVIGAQYQDHNPTPGPVYAGGGYTPINAALKTGPDAVRAMLDASPELVHEISTGGARPLHMAGMSRRAQQCAALLIERGADLEARDTYEYTPLHRMASNNLALGASVLIEAGADLESKTSRGETPLSVAIGSRALDVVALLLRAGATL